MKNKIKEETKFRELEVIIIKTFIGDLPLKHIVHKRIVISLRTKNSITIHLKLINVEQI